MIKGFNHKLEQQPAPAFFVRGPSSFARLAFFSALSIALIATDTRLQYLTDLRQGLIYLLQPFQAVANAPAQLYRNTNEYFTTHHNLLNQNQQFKQQLLKQGIALQRLSTLMLENEHLRNLLEANKVLKESSILGEIVHIGRDPFTKKVIVNRGIADQVVAGAAVVDAVGVIGQVTRTYGKSSEVTLITDASLAIPIQVERNGLRAIAFGHGRDQTLDLPFLPANVDIRRGDVLVTSGIDGVYPAGLKVASVTQVKVSPDSPFARIVCVPTGGVENHSQVLLVSIARSEISAGDEVVATAKPSTKTTQPKLEPTTNTPSKTHAPQ